jgi:Type II secretion system (T2SS), protein M subtype b
MIVQHIGRGHRLLALTALGSALLIMTYAVLVPLYKSHHDTRETIEVAKATRERLQAMAHYDLNGLDEASLTASSAYRDDFLQGAAEAIVAGNLQSMLRDLIVANSAEMNSAQTLPDVKHGSSSYAGLRIQMRASLDQVQTILHAVENNRPYLFVERLHLRAENTVVGDQGISGIAAVRVLADLDVFGARWPRSSGLDPKK